MPRIRCWLPRPEIITWTQTLEFEYGTYVYHGDAATLSESFSTRVQNILNVRGQKSWRERQRGKEKERQTNRDRDSDREQYASESSNFPVMCIVAKLLSLFDENCEVIDDVKWRIVKWRLWAIRKSSATGKHYNNVQKFVWPTFKICGISLSFEIVKTLTTKIIGRLKLKIREILTFSLYPSVIGTS